MKVLLLGGTGAMGMYLADILSEEGHEVVITSRSERINRPHLTYIKGDAHNRDFISVLLNDHYDAIVDFMVYGNEEFQLVISDLLAATDQYFFISSSRVYDPHTPTITEESPLLIDSLKTPEYQSSNAYSLYKAQQERVLKEAGTGWTIIRPYITYSSQRLPLGILEKEDWLFRALNGRPIVFSETIRDKKTVLTWGKDVALGMASLIGKASAIGEIFHITSSCVLTWGEVLDIYLTAIHQKTGLLPKVVYSSDDYLLKGGIVDQAINDRYFDHSFDNSKISKYLNTNNFKKPEDGIRDCINEFLSNPLFKNIIWTMEGRRDKMSHSFTPLCSIPSLRNKLFYLACRFINK